MLVGGGLEDDVEEDFRPVNLSQIDILTADSESCSTYLLAWSQGFWRRVESNYGDDERRLQNIFF